LKERGVFFKMAGVLALFYLKHISSQNHIHGFGSGWIDILFYEAYLMFQWKRSKDFVVQKPTFMFLKK